jgi:predicted RNA-binding protein Jag
MARTAKKATVLDDLTKRVGRARSRAEKVLEKGWKATLEVLPPPARKAVKETTARIEKVATDLDKRRAEAVKLVERRRKEITGRIEKERKALTGRIAKERKALTGRIAKQSRELTKTGRELASQIEKSAVGIVKPIVERLDVASRSDVERLSKRISTLEQRLGRKPKHAAAA